MDYELYTDPARRAILNAQAEAGKQGCIMISPEHLLVGLMSEEEGFVDRVLDDLGVSEGEIFLELAPNLKEVGPTIREVIPLSDKLRRILHTAYVESLMLTHTYIGPEHLFLAIVKADDNLAAQVLCRLGVNYDEVMRRAKDPRFTQPSEAKTLLAIRSDLLRLAYSIGLHKSIHKKPLCKQLMLLLLYIERKVRVVDQMLEERKSF
jgi:ATP-dependent Clp protease ATP-binding subunit ClpA